MRRFLKNKKNEFFSENITSDVIVDRKEDANDFFRKTTAELLELNNESGFFKKKQVKLFVMPQDYMELVVDGDWTQALQKAFDQRGTVFIPNGEYMISEPLIIYGGTKVVGENVHPRGSIGTCICGAFVGEYLIKIASKDEKNELNYAEDVELDSLKLVNWNNIKTGIYSECISRGSFTNLYIDKFMNMGMQIKDSWITTIEKITVIGQGSDRDTIAFELFGTSCNMQNCYAFNCRNGYKLNLFYSTISACASDHIGNENNYGIVYDIGGYNTGILNCGAEQCYGTLVRASERACNVKGMSAMTHYINRDYPLFSNYINEKVSDSFKLEDISVVFRDLTVLNGEKIYSWKSHPVNQTDILVNRISLYQNNQSFDARKLNIYEYETEYLGEKSKINFKNYDFIDNKHPHVESLKTFDKVKYFRVKNGAYLTFHLYNENPYDLNSHNDNDIHGKLEVVCRTTSAYIFDFKSFGKFDFKIYSDCNEFNTKFYSIIALHIRSDITLDNICIRVNSTDVYEVISKNDIDEQNLIEKIKLQ